MTHHTVKPPLSLLHLKFALLPTDHNIRLKISKCQASYTKLLEWKISINLAFWVSNAAQNVWYICSYAVVVSHWITEVETNLSYYFSSLSPAPARYCAERQYERSWAGVSPWPRLCGPDANHLPRAAQPPQLAGEQLSCWMPPFHLPFHLKVSPTTTGLYALVHRQLYRFFPVCLGEHIMCQSYDLRRSVAHALSWSVSNLVLYGCVTR